MARDDRELCECSKCGRQHWKLADNPPDAIVRPANPHPDVKDEAGERAMLIEDDLVAYVRDQAKRDHTFAKGIHKEYIAKARELISRIDASPARAEAAEAQLRLTGTEDAGVRALVEAAEPFAQWVDGMEADERYRFKHWSDDLPPKETLLLGSFRRLRDALKPFRRT